MMPIVFKHKIFTTKKGGSRMKKIPLFIALFSLLGGFCFAQSNNVADYAVEDIYMYYGKMGEIGTTRNGTAYSFVNEPIFANENEGLFDALLNKKLVPSVLLKTLPISIPITMKLVQSLFLCD